MTNKKNKLTLMTTKHVFENSCRPYVWNQVNHCCISCKMLVSN